MFEERTAYGKLPVRHLPLNDRLTLSTSGQCTPILLSLPEGLQSSPLPQDREDSHHLAGCEHRPAVFGGRWDVSVQKFTVQSTTILYSIWRNFVSRITLGLSSKCLVACNLRRDSSFRLVGDLWAWLGTTDTSTRIFQTKLPSFTPTTNLHSTWGNMPLLFTPTI